MIRKILRILRRVLIGLGVLLISAIAVGAVWQAWAVQRDAGRFPPPGEMVDIGTHRLHLDCRGSGSPTVLLEAGGQLWSSGWRYIHDDLAERYTVCAYDRSGLGWSEQGPGPYDAEQAVEELHALLDAAGLSRPFVYVGHSLGGMLARVYHRRYPDDIAAAVYIDSGEPEILIDDFEASRDDPVRSCSFNCRLQIGAAWLGVTRLVLSQVDMLDDPELSPEAVAEFRARASLPSFIDSALKIAHYIPRASFQTLDAGPIEDRPLLVLYSGEYGSLVSAGEDPAEMARWKASYVDAWAAGVAASPAGVGPIEVPGANHLSVVTYRSHSARVSDEISSFVGNHLNGTKTRAASAPALR